MAKLVPPKLENTPEKNVFVMMRFRDTDAFKSIEIHISKALLKYGLYARFAKDVRKDELLWNHITKYMDQCSYGIAIFDGLPLDRDEPLLNPNVCTELGYMLAKGKRCLILKDRNLTLQTDLLGFVWIQFDSNRLSGLKKTIENWVEQEIQALPLLQGLAMLWPNSKIARRLNEHAHYKLSIGKYLAEKYLPDSLPRGNLILDSGTTVAAVAEALFLNRSKYTSLDIYTNNILACVLLCSASSIRCHLVPGIVDHEFGGVFGPEAESAISRVKADITILACTSFTREYGPYANSSENLSFKRAIIENKRIIIVIAAPRIGKSVGKPILKNKNDWNRVLEENVELIVTSFGKKADELKKCCSKKVIISELVE